MKAFAALLDRLAYTPSRNDKLRLLADYFATTPDPERGYALAALTDGLFFRLPVRRILGELLGPRVDPVLFDLSRDYVGDTAETIALIWPGGKVRAKPLRLAEIVETLQSAPPAEAPALLANWLDQLELDRALGAAQAHDRRTARRCLGPAGKDGAGGMVGHSARRYRGGLAWARAAL